MHPRCQSPTKYVPWLCWTTYSPNTPLSQPTLMNTYVTTWVHCSNKSVNSHTKWHSHATPYSLPPAHSPHMPSPTNTVSTAHMCATPVHADGRATLEATQDETTTVVVPQLDAVGKTYRVDRCTGNLLSTMRCNNLCVHMYLTRRAALARRAAHSTRGAAGSGPCLLYTSPSPRDLSTSRMPSSA